MSAWAWGWVGFGVWFVVLETAAIVASTRARRAGDPRPRMTLSQHIWWLAGFGRYAAGPAKYLRRTVLIGALAWLVAHFIGGGDIV